MDSDEFMIAKNGSWGNGGIKIASSCLAYYGHTGYKYVYESGTWGINITGTASSETLATVTSRGASTSSQISFTKTDDHAISVGTIRGRAVGSQTGDYIMMYERVHIGYPSGWGAAAADAPSYGLGVWGNIHVSKSNATGGGIILADDGDIVDLNDAYCSMRFTSGVRIFSANRGGSAVITLGSNGNISAGNISTGVNASHIVQRDANGYIYANHINFSTSESENPTINSFFTSNGDGWSRKSTLAHVKNSIRGVADGTWGINITGNANTVGSYTLQNIIPYHSGSDFPNGTLVVTNINASVTYGDSFVMEVTGKSYQSGNSPFSLILQGYIYADTYINCSAMNNGTTFPNIVILNYNGNLAFWWPRISYWNSFSVSVREAGGSSSNRVTSIGDSTEPASSKKVTVSPFHVVHSGNIGSQSVNYASTANSAVRLDGTANGATLYTNNSSYGSWRVGGSRNGWYGIEFENQANLMMNTDTTGFHNNSYGWQWRWTQGKIGRAHV